MGQYKGIYYHNNIFFNFFLFSIPLNIGTLILQMSVSDLFKKYVVTLKVITVLCSFLLLP